MLLEPEWLAKSEHLSILQNDRRYISIISQHIKKLFECRTKSKQIYKVYIPFSINDKFTQVTGFVKTMAINKFICRKLYSFLNRQEYTDVYYELKYFLRRRDHLNQILHTIYWTGLEWYLYTNLKEKYLYLDLYLINTTQNSLYLVDIFNLQKLLRYVAQFASNKLINLQDTLCILWTSHKKDIDIHDIQVDIRKATKPIIEPSNQALKFTTHILRSKLYHKNEFGFWRRNNQANIHKNLLFTENLLKCWCSYYSAILNPVNKRAMNQKIDSIIYLWQRKNKKHNR